MKYYAVKQGKQPGIYETWAACLEQVHGFKGAVFKSFEALEDAKQFLQDETPVINWNLPTAFIDGSYSKKNNRYSYGGFIQDGDRVHIIQGSGDNAEYMKEWNIAGELLGALQVLYACLRLDIPEINLCFDYAGIEGYATGWKASTPLAKYYKSTVDLLSDDVRIHFLKVKGHTGIEGNELADLLAKEAAGVHMRKKDAAALQAFREGVKV